MSKRLAVAALAMSLGVGLGLAMPPGVHEAAGGLAAEDRARVAEDRARVAEDRARVGEGHVRPEGLGDHPTSGPVGCRPPDELVADVIGNFNCLRVRPGVARVLHGPQKQDAFACGRRDATWALVKPLSC